MWVEDEAKDIADLPTATRADLMADAPIGIYLMSDEERRIERIYDVALDQFREGPTSCLGRVMPRLPNMGQLAGVDFAADRPDGLMVVICRVLDEGIGRLRRWIDDSSSGA